MDALARINALPAGEAHGQLMRCCGSTRWAERMAAARPFRDAAALVAAAESAWKALSHEDWLEAFSQHPRIGDRDALEERFGRTAEWSLREQAGVGPANAQLLDGLAEANRRYEAKFGYIFIVCAAGKSASDMLSILNQRLDNDRQSEIVIAAEEQLKITRLRLETLLKELG